MYERSRPPGSSLLSLPLPASSEALKFLVFSPSVPSAQVGPRLSVPLSIPPMYVHALQAKQFSSRMHLVFPLAFPLPSAPLLRRRAVDSGDTKETPRQGNNGKRDRPTVRPPWKKKLITPRASRCYPVSWTIIDDDCVCVCILNRSSTYVAYNKYRSCHLSLHPFLPGSRIGCPVNMADWNKHTQPLETWAIQA